MPERFELFVGESCEAMLPVNGVIEEHTFGQFVTLAIRVQNEQRPINLMQNSSEGVSIHEQLRFMDNSVPLESVVNDTFSNSQLITEIKIDEHRLNQLLAFKNLTVQNQKVQLPLDSAMVASLISGHPITMAVKEGKEPYLIRIVPPVAEARIPAVTRYDIEDLSAFLADPRIPGIDGSPYYIKLSAELIAELRKNGSAQYKEGKSTIELIAANKISANTKSMMLKNSAAYEQLTINGQRTQGSSTPTPGARSWNAPHAALFLPWKQRWELLGYSRGILLHSLSLAPQEETTIEIFTWDRKKRSLEQESDTETEQSFERSDITKDTIDVVNELTNSGEFQAQADARVKVNYPVVQAEVGGQLSYKDNVTKISKRTAQHLTESTSKAATRVKTKRTTKITETMEMGREQRVTRKVRNPNMCHTVNLDYFEIVANYRVVTQFAEEDAAICVLIDMPDSISSIRLDEPRNCRIHEKALTAALLDRNLSSGFDAARLLASREFAKGLVCDKVHCQAETVSTPPRGNTQPQSERPEPAIPDEVTNAFDRVTDAGRQLINRSYSPLLDYWRNSVGDPPAQYVAEFRMWLYWSLLSRLIPRLSNVLTSTSESLNNDRLRMQNIFDSIPGLEAVVRPSTLLEEQQIKSDFDNVIWSALNRGYHSVSRWAVWWWDSLRGYGALRPDDNGLIAALNDFQRIYGNWRRSQQSGEQGISEEQLRQQQQQQQVDMDNDRMEYAYPLRDLADAKERLDALLAHLMLHRSYYHYAILQAMPLGDQMQLLAGADAPLELCEPRVIGMIQGTSGAPDRIAVPLNMALLTPGDHALGNQQALIELKRFVEEIISELREGDGGSRNISLPTSGVMLESRLGHCDACETFIGQSREIELEQRRQQVRSLSAATALQEAEARRYEARLSADPPQLDNPIPSTDPIRVELNPVQVKLENSSRPNS